jgi:hypothetical protein
MVHGSASLTRHKKLKAITCAVTSMPRFGDIRLVAIAHSANGRLSVGRVIPLFSSGGLVFRNSSSRSPVPSAHGGALARIFPWRL